ncbi:MAG: metallophosphoesterase [Anaerolineales bacterium]|nr:metallophosphoesterase [Anaerolineales bacterium]
MKTTNMLSIQRVPGNQNKPKIDVFGTTITWLHLSDFHIHASSNQQWDEDYVLRRMVRDIQKIAIKVKFDFILVTGDIAFSGKVEEYELAKRLFDQLLKVTNLQKEHLFVIPGNHDIDRNSVTFLTKSGRLSISQQSDISEILNSNKDRGLYLSCFKNYFDFIKNYFDDSYIFNNDELGFVRRLAIKNTVVEILGLNSAWLAYGDHDDCAKLALGEKQVNNVIEKCNDADWRIAIMHHPFDWLHVCDKYNAEDILLDKCDFILNGHLHYPRLKLEKTFNGNGMKIFAGACFESRETMNHYNIVKLDLDSQIATILLRMWSNRAGGFWTEDTQSYKQAVNGQALFNLKEIKESLAIKPRDET